MQTINILRTTLETEGFGMYLIHARHDGVNIHEINLHLVEDGVVGPVLPAFNVETCPGVVERLTELLRENP